MAPFPTVGEEQEIEKETERDTKRTRNMCRNKVGVAKGWAARHASERWWSGPKGNGKRASKQAKKQKGRRCPHHKLIVHPTNKRHFPQIGSMTKSTRKHTHTHLRIVFCLVRVVPG